MSSQEERDGYAQHFSQVWGQLPPWLTDSLQKSHLAALQWNHLAVILASSLTLYAVFALIRSAAHSRILRHCHFCVGKVKVDSLTGLCTACGQCNKFSLDGDHAEKPVEFFYADLNGATPVKRQPQAPSCSDVLCNRCQANQEQQLEKLRMFESEADGVQFQRELSRYKAELEILLPLCRPCQKKVYQTLAAQEDMLTGKYGVEQVRQVLTSKLLLKPERDTRSVIGIITTAIATLCCLILLCLTAVSLFSLSLPRAAVVQPLCWILLLASLLNACARPSAYSVLRCTAAAVSMLARHDTSHTLYLCVIQLLLTLAEPVCEALFSPPSPQRIATARRRVEQVRTPEYRSPVGGPMTPVEISTSAAHAHVEPNNMSRRWATACSKSPQFDEDGTQMDWAPSEAESDDPAPRNGIASVASPSVTCRPDSLFADSLNESYLSRSFYAVSGPGFLALASITVALFAIISAYFYYG